MHKAVRWVWVMGGALPALAALFCFPVAMMGATPPVAAWLLHCLHLPRLVSAARVLRKHIAGHRIRPRTGTTADIAKFA